MLTKCDVKKIFNENIKDLTLKGLNKETKCGLISKICLTTVTRISVLVFVFRKVACTIFNKYNLLSSYFFKTYNTYNRW